MRVRPLRQGEAVGVVATSGPVHPGRLSRGIQFLEASGHPVVRGPSLLAKHGYLAGPDGRRAADLNAAIRSRELPGIFFARGGWGAARILDRLDLKCLQARPRVLLGFSDLTSLFMALQRPGRPYPVRYGPTVAQLGESGAYHLGSLREALYLPKETIAHPLERCRILRPGRGGGVLVGGCLALLVGLLGTRYDMPWDGCVLFWEDVNEEPYRIDRMLTQLRLAGKLDGLAGMVIGRLTGCRPRRGSPTLPLEEIVREATRGTRYPIVMEFPAGHVSRKRTLLLGVPAVLDTRRGTLALEAAP